MKTLLARLFGKGSASRRTGGAPSFRPRVEGLEERALMSVGAEFHINTKTVLDQDQPAVASQPVSGGGSVVVWRDQISANDTDILAQRFDGSGNKVGGEILVATGAVLEYQPAVAMNAAGNFVITWTEHVGGNDNVLAQQFLANGTRNGRVITVASSSANEFDSNVALDQLGNFVVSFSFFIPDQQLDVMARRFGTNGELLAEIPIGISRFAEHSSSLAGSPDGRFSIAFVTEGLGNGNIVLKRFSAAGELLSTGIAGADNKREINPDVAMDRFGNTIVVWELETSTFDHDIRAQKTFSDGVVGSVLALARSTEFEYSPTVAMDLNGGNFVIAFNQVHNTGSGLAGPNNLVVQEFIGTGTLLSTSNLGPSGDSPALSINLSGQYFLVYSGLNRLGDPGAGVFGRRGFLGGPVPAVSHMFDPTLAVGLWN